jgi:MFS family permease
MGPHAIITAGGLPILCCVAGNLAFGSAFSTFIIALMLLGVGLNFMFIGGTTLLTAAHDPHERVRVQATNDFIVFGTVACTALASGAIEAGAGWTVLNLTVVPPVLIAVALVFWHWTARQRLAPG